MASAQLVAYPNGAIAPAKTPEVLAAEAAHFAAYPAVPVAPYAAPYAAGPIAPVAPALVAHPNGAVVPADEPAVVAARADHLRSKGIPFHG